MSNYRLTLHGLTDAGEISVETATPSTQSLSSNESLPELSAGMTLTLEQIRNLPVAHRISA